MSRYIIVFLLLCCFNIVLNAQDEEFEQTTIDGELVYYYVAAPGDTVLLYGLDSISVSSPRTFEDREEYRKYLKYRRYANVVFPYAIKAIKIFREADEVTRTMKKGKKKKHMKRLQKQLKDEFEDPLRNLTKTQGLILTKMIENELETPFYDLIKNLRGSFVASYWNTLGKVNGYRLRDGYKPGEDHILDTVINDFDISYKK